jgi:hypothetical protein
MKDIWTATVIAAFFIGISLSSAEATLGDHCAAPTAFSTCAQPSVTRAEGRENGVRAEAAVKKPKGGTQSAPLQSQERNEPQLRHVNVGQT